MVGVAQGPEGVPVAQPVVWYPTGDSPVPVCRS